ncbi:noncanonical pyrimidine nucleotidase, YjjG family protein [Undibacterium sp. YM2]|uniref:HAD family hydrolase n=1 Tax=Undibacterium sp. YM2 TaxID=2058625 RepID=UPI001331DD52|nr:HAD family hydrolase [Undibacterium sp. YM2]BBB69390.1 noncanonical pyrimidine nucleotidase, YjjG family protein [Undibacterium sp. YM2]
MLSANKASLLFDIDNTLVDRDAAFNAYIQNFISRNQAAFSGEDMSLLQAEMIALDCHGRKDRKLFCQELLQRFPRLPYTAESLWEDHMSLPDFVKPDSVLSEMLERLSLDYQLMIISNGSAHVQRRKLQSAGLTDYFEHIFISAEVGYAKPDTRLFSHALSYAYHASVVMIGDDYINDMQPAMAMQLKTVFVSPENETVAVRPDRVLSGIHDLEEALACMI